MEYKTKRLDKVSAELVIQHSGEEVQDAYKKAYLKARGKVKVKGFRPGKAPLDLVEKELGESVITDAANILISETYENIFEEIDPPPYNVPQFEIVSFDKDSGAEFTGKYDTWPEIKIGKYKKIKATKDDPTVSEETVNADLLALQNQHAIVKAKEEEETAQTGDVVAISMELTHEGTQLYNNENAFFTLGEVDFPPQINDKLAGLKKNDEYSYETTIDDGFADSRFAGKTIQVKGEIKQVQSKELPELDDDFAQDLGEYESLDQLKDQIRTGYKNMADSVLKGRAIDEIILEIVNGAKLDIPPSMLRNEFDYRISLIKRQAGIEKEEFTVGDLAELTGRSVEDVTKEVEEIAERHVKERLVLIDIADKEGLTISDEEVEEEFNKRWGAYIKPDQMKELKKRQDLRVEIEERLIMDKAINWVYDNGEIKKGKEVSYESLREEGVFER